MSRAADNLFSKAEQAIKRRNFDYAIELLLQGLKLDPLNVEQRKRLRNTEILAVQEKGGNPKGDLKTGLVTLKTQWAVKKLGLAKKWEEQIVEIENYLRHAPQNVGMLTVLAQALRSLENGTEAAIAVLLQIVELDPGQVETWRQLGILYGPIDPQKAIACWEKVKRYKPEDKEAGKAIRDLSAQTMMKSAEDRKKSGKGDFTDLLASADEAKKLEEEQAIIRTDDDARRAIERTKEKIAKAPEEKRLIRQLGDLYRRLKQYVDAEAQYKRLLELDPNDLVAQERLAELQEYIYSDRIEELKIKLKDAPDDADLQAQIAKANEEFEDFLVVLLERRVRMHPTDCGLKARYGDVLLKKDRVDEAIEQFQKALVDPRLATLSHANLGRCFKAKGLYDLAIDEFQKTLHQISDANSSLAKDIRYALAETHALKGDFTLARSTMEQILAVDIRFRDVSDNVVEYRNKEKV